MSARRANKQKTVKESVITKQEYRDVCKDLQQVALGRINKKGIIQQYRHSTQTCMEYRQREKIKEIVENVTLHQPHKVWGGHSLAELLIESEYSSTICGNLIDHCNSPLISRKFDRESPIEEAAINYLFHDIHESILDEVFVTE